MQLVQLKLSGFKSFVDTTIIPLKESIIAIVGPNGCGKSNIVDAILWVMGESLMKNLRTAVSTDVIFKGSSARKAVGLASVELIFDNRLGKILGSYSQYQEIAIKRSINLDGDNVYFINGIRCRKRDIIDLFLGSGVGKNGYGIISQGLVSRLIEARPEDLKIYLEEAAGVSHYKERRRETLHSINDTKENLLRLSDILSELHANDIKLSTQADAANQFKALHLELNNCKQEIVTIQYHRWQQDLTSAQNKHADLVQAYLDLENTKALLQQELSQLRQTWHQENTELYAAQQNLHDLMQNITRATVLQEQKQQEKISLQNQLEKLQKNKQDISLDLHKAQNLAGESEQVLAQVLLQLQEAQAVLQLKLTELGNDELLSQSWQQKFNVVAQEVHHLEKNLAVSMTHAEHLEQAEQKNTSKLEYLKQTLSAIDLPQIASTLNVKKQAYEENTLNHQSLSTSHDKSVQSLQDLRKERDDLEQHIYKVQDKLHQILALKAELTATYEAALQAQHIPQELNNFTSLLSQIKLKDKAWLASCEKVLGDNLHAKIFHDFSELINILPSLQGQNLSFVKLQAQDKSFANSMQSLYLDVAPIFPINLAEIYLADDLEQGMNLLATLSLHESVVTLDGYWLSHNFVKIFGIQEHTSILLIQEKIANIMDDHKDIADELAGLLDKRKFLYNNITASESLLQKSHVELSKSAQALQESSLALSIADNTHKQSMQRYSIMEEDLKALLTEISLCKDSFLSELAKQKDYKINLADCMQKQDSIGAEKSRVEQGVILLRQDVKALQNRVNSSNDACNVAQYRKQQLLLEQKNFSSRTTMIEQDISVLTRKIAELDVVLLSNMTLLEDNFEKKRLVATQIESKEHKLAEEKNKLTKLEGDYTSFEIKITAVAKDKQQLSADLQGIELKLANLCTLIEQENFNLKSIQNAEPKFMNLQEYMDLSNAKKVAIKALGDVNLLAINEHKENLQRLQHLHKEYDDLVSALTVLDEAIATMDKETLSKLQDTFVELNKVFTGLFPKFFGGGRAYLSLTCDNILDAGVVVMAEPPGKKNAAISLLSGGEKAMTAMALVFAMFMLNPSPFCILDEVDAPLDDANVHRLCAVITDLSHTVQFLIVTHNKTTMEIAQHLVGISMQEPGVSRVVTVDVAQVS
jgi:chromosome segregation protein